MTSRHLVDPELIPILDAIPDMGVSAEQLPQTRGVIAAMTEAGLAAADQSVSVSEHIAPGRDGHPPVRIRLYRPDGAPAGAPALLHMHGGGFVFGTAALGDPRNRVWAKSLNCVLAAVDYRLAPETPYPGALEDCYAALEWLHAEARALQIDATRVALSGESAGGGLAAALALLARDRGGPPLCFQLLIYPMLDDRTCTTKVPNPFAGEFVWDRTANAHAWRSYLGAEPGAESVAAYAAPARAIDLSGLPACFIGTTALDLFVDENLEYARRLMHAGVAVELHSVPGAFHGFDAVAPAAAISERLTQSALTALKRAFAR